MIGRRGLLKSLTLQFPGDRRIEEKEREKTEKYQGLRRELQKIWNVKAKVIPLVMDSLGAIPTPFGNRVKETDITAEIGQVQKTFLLRTARILKKVFKT